MTEPMYDKGGDWPQPSRIYRSSDTAPSEATVPWEAFDETHPDHADWVEGTGRCLANHDHAAWLAAQ